MSTYNTQPFTMSTTVILQSHHYLPLLLTNNKKQCDVATTKYNEANRVMKEQRAFYDSLIIDITSTTDYIQRIELEATKPNVNLIALNAHLKEHRELLELKKIWVNHDFNMLQKAILDIQFAEVELLLATTLARFYDAATRYEMTNVEVNAIIANSPRGTPGDSSIEELYQCISYWKNMTEILAE